MVDVRGGGGRLGDRRYCRLVAAWMAAEAAEGVCPAAGDTVTGGEEMRTIDEIKADLVVAIKAAYLVGVSDGHDDNVAFEDGVEESAWEQVNAAFQSLGIDDDRLEKICNAERDGRCVVLPCKPGKEVWVANHIKHEVVRGHFIGMFGDAYIVGLGLDQIKTSKELPITMFADAIHFSPEAAEATLKGGDGE